MAHENENGDQSSETEVDQSEDGRSEASFVSGKEIYLSRAEILNKIHKVNPEKRSGVTRVNKSPITNGDNNHHEQKINGKISANRKKPSQHDSWSSRASSILKDPEAIYVSRVELLQKINVLEDAVRKEKAVNGRAGTDERDGRERKSASPPGPRDADKRDGRQKRQHDSWSSRASSILAAMEQDQVRNN